MIKAKGTFGGRETLMLGLSHGNLKKFLSEADTYIRIHREEVEIPFDIIIFAAETERDMYEMLKKDINPDAKIHMTDKIKEEW